MAIADEKIKQSIRRDTLIRMEVKADVTDHLSYVSGISYKVYMPIGQYYEPAAVYQDGSSKPLSWDADTNYLTTQLTLPLNEYYPVTVIIYIYLTTEETKYLDKDDPTGAISNVAEWEPRLQANLTYKEYVRDIFAGNFPFATGSSFAVINSDGHLDDFFTRPEDYICPYYFFKNEVKIWQGLNDSYQFVGNFYTESMAISNSDSISFNVKPESKKLMAPATFGDSDAETIATKTNYPNIDPSQSGSAIPLIFSPSNSTDTQANALYGQPEGVFIGNVSRLNRAININYSETAGVGVNDTFICGRSPDPLGPAFKTIGVTGGIVGNTVTTTGSAGSITWRKAIINNPIDNFSVVAGCYVDAQWSDGSWTGYEVMPYIDNDTHEVWIRDRKPLTLLQIKRANPIQAWIRDPGSSSNILASVPNITITSLTQAPTEGGNYLIEATLLAGSYPPDYEIYFTFFTDVYYRNAEYLAYEFLDAVGMPHNYISTTLTGNPAFFQVPRASEKDFKSYAEYLPSVIMPMTMSMLRYDYNTEKYEFEPMPSTIDSSNYPSTFHDITDTDIIDRAVSFIKRYDDMITKLNVVNNDIFNSEHRQLSSKTYFNRQESNVYGESQIREIDHASMYPETAPYDLAKVNDMLRTPTVRYSLTVSLKFFDVKVLDVIKLTSTKIMNAVDDGTSFVYLVVTSVEKGKSSINIEAQQVTYL